MREEPFWIRTIGWLDKQDGVEPLNFGMSRQDFAPCGAVERGKPERSLGIARQHELNAIGAEATGAIVQQDG